MGPADLRRFGGGERIVVLGNGQPGRDHQPVQLHRVRRLIRRLVVVLEEKTVKKLAISMASFVYLFDRTF